MTNIGLPDSIRLVDAGFGLALQRSSEHRVEECDVEAVAHFLVEGLGTDGVECLCKPGMVVNARGGEPIVEVMYIGVDAVKCIEEVDKRSDMELVASR